MNRTMDYKIKFAKNVLLLDVSFLNEMVSGFHSALSKKLGRELPSIDLAEWISYLMLDAGLRNAKNEMQVFLIHAATVQRMSGVEPADLKSLDGMACQTSLGEISFACVTPEDITDNEHLFVDLMTLAVDAADVERLLLVPDYSRYAPKIETDLQELLKDKEAKLREKVCYFTLGKQDFSFCPTDSILFSLTKAWGIQPEEMK